jgi:lipoyl(octanoyl) transferase
VRRKITVFRLGRIAYDEAHSLQERIQRARIRGAIGDTLLLLEHPPVITLGRGAKAAHVLLPEETLAARGFTVHEVGRGGDVTYHGPGQIVGYPIIDLSPDRKDVRRYVQDLEEIMIRLAGSFDLRAARVDKLNGTWIGDNKIGAVGVRISRWVTMHGFAFNVSTDLSHFDAIVPCGIRGRGVTSLTRELEREVPIDDTLDRLERHVSDVLDADLVRADRAPLDGIDPAAWAPDPWRTAVTSQADAGT